MDTLPHQTDTPVTELMLLMMIRILEIWYIMNKRDCEHLTVSSDACFINLSSTWPHLNSDVGLEEGEY